MKKTFCLLLLIFTFSFSYSQGANWKSISTPFKSNVNLLKQTEQGVLFANTNNNIGQVISYDNGLSWTYMPFYLSYNTCRSDINGNIVFNSYNSVFRLNTQTFKVDTFNTQGYSADDAHSFVDSFVVIKEDRKVLTLDRNGGKNYLSAFPSQNIVILSSSLAPICYVIETSSTKEILYKVTESGNFENLRNWPRTEATYFLHSNTLIRNTEYSDNEGLSWIKYNLPFEVPDYIFNYNGKIAFVKGSKIYYKTSSINSFEVLDLPTGTSYKEMFAGKTIVVKTNSGNKILRDPNGVFEPLLYDLETPMLNSFAAGKGENVIITDPKNNAYIKLDSISNWVNTGYSCYSHFFSTSQGNLFSFNKDNILSLLDQNTGNLFSTDDRGQTWDITINKDSTNVNLLSERKKGTLWTGDSSLKLRKLGSTTWETLKVFEKDQYGGFMSNQLKYFSDNPLFIGLYFTDTLNSYYRIIDLPMYDYNFDLHYEMNYIYNSSRINEDYLYRFSKDYLSRSFDNGVSFEKVLESDTFSQTYFLRLLWTGHILKVYRDKIFISDDYGKSWNPINIDLSSRDYISSVAITPDYYLYVNTAEKGLLKYKTPLPMANIIRLNIKEDLLGDCITGNDTSFLENIKVSLEGQATQLTDHDGNAVFYTFKSENRLIIHDEAQILDLCQDTIPVIFNDDNGLETEIVVNSTTNRKCPNLTLKFVDFEDTLTNYSSFKVIISNNGNEISPDFKLRLELDPYQFLNSIDSTIENPSDLVYLFNIKGLSPGESYLNDLYIRIKPDVPFDRLICTSAQIDDYGNQCTSNEKITLCNNVKRIGGNKTIIVQFYNDLNGNCIQESNEPFINEYLGIENNIKEYFISSIDSVRYIQTISDSNHIKISYDNDLYDLCQDTYDVFINKDSLTFELNIPVKEIKYCSKLSTSFSQRNNIRCFDTHLQFYIRNKGTASSGAVNTIITVDNYFDVMNVSPQPYQIVDNKYYFELTSIAMREFKVIEFDVNISCDAPLGHLHCHEINIEENNPVCNLNKNFNQFCRRNGGSYDPNDKTIFASGKENIDLIAIDDKIEYRIRFQNTGTDTAYTVRIEDYISTSFDISSIQMVHTTHPCLWDVQNRTLIVDFQNINLVDSFTNALDSQGEILFEIALSKETVVGDKISNKANIFFDLNTPVATNEVFSTIGLSLNSIDVSLNKMEEIIFKPNPTNSFTRIVGIDQLTKHEAFVYSAQGSLIAKYQLNKGNDILDVSTLAPGPYFIMILESDSLKFGKLIKI